MSRQGAASLWIWGAWGSLGLPRRLSLRLPRSLRLRGSEGDGIPKHGPRVIYECLCCWLIRTRFGPFQYMTNQPWRRSRRQMARVTAAQQP